jgi:hypothetical protein
MSEFGRKIAIRLLQGYKRWISPGILPSCKYVPTCSEYAMEAVAQHGVVRGGLLAVWRVLRCNPLARGGYDPAVRHEHAALPGSELRITNLSR